VYCLLSETALTYCLPSVCCNEDDSTNRSRASITSRGSDLIVLIEAGIQGFTVCLVPRVNCNVIVLLFSCFVVMHSRPYFSLYNWAP